MAVRLRQRGRAAESRGVPGAVLRLPITVEAQYAAQWTKLVKTMYDELLAMVEATYRTEPPAIEGDVMDASSYVDQLVSRMGARFEVMFGKAAMPMAKVLVERVNKASDKGMDQSLREIGAQQLTLDTGALTPAVRSTLQFHVSENVDLIKKIPREFLADVKKDVSDSILKGDGLQDLKPKLEERYGEARRHAHNVALDQTRKAYNDLNAARMEDAGISKFEWIHTGGSNQPRPYHLARWPNGLNGGIFDLKDPPVIDPKTGERGLPGHAIYCRCTMRPVVTFD